MLNIKTHWPKRGGAGWIRRKKVLLQFKKTKPLFSERYGYIKFTKIPFSRWRFNLSFKD